MDTGIKLNLVSMKVNRLLNLAIEANASKKNAPDSTMFHSKKTKKMTALNNLNQLLSRVKTIFGRKASPAANAATSAEPPTDISVIGDPRLKAALADIENYLRENYGTPTAKLRYKDYTNGTSLTSEDATFAVSLVILTTAGGAAHLPDNVLLLGGATSTNDVKWLAAELRKFTNFLMQLCPKHRIQHLAFAFDKTESDDPHIVKKPTSPASASTKP